MSQTIDGVTLECDREFVTISIEGGEDTVCEWVTASDARAIAAALIALADEADAYVPPPKPITRAGRITGEYRRTTPEAE